MGGLTIARGPWLNYSTFHGKVVLFISKRARERIRLKENLCSVPIFAMTYKQGILGRNKRQVVFLFLSIGQIVTKLLKFRQNKKIVNSMDYLFKLTISAFAIK